METTPPIPLAIADGRRALSRMYIDLTKAFHASIFPPGTEPDDPDANLDLVAVTVMFGHADGRPMGASEIAAELGMPRSSVLGRLNLLVERGLTVRVGDKYYIEPNRAAYAPHLDTFNLILSQGFAVLGPLLSKSDR